MWKVVKAASLLGVVSPVGEAKPNFYSPIPLPNLPYYYIRQACCLHHTSRQEGSRSHPCLLIPGADLSKASQANCLSTSTEGKKKGNLKFSVLALHNRIPSFLPFDSMSCCFYTTIVGTTSLSKANVFTMKLFHRSISKQEEPSVVLIWKF